jgi:carbon monoxide dehydrogenase subunit G
MVHAHDRVDIQKPPTEVFAFLADGLNNKLWRPSVRTIELASGTASTVGATYTGAVAGPGGSVVAGEYAITALVPDAGIDFRLVAGGMNATGSYVLEPTASGTRVTYSADFQPTGLLRFATGPIQKALDGEVASVTELKRVLES